MPITPATALLRDAGRNTVWAEGFVSRYLHQRDATQRLRLMPGGPSPALQTSMDAEAAYRLIARQLGITLPEPARAGEGFEALVRLWHPALLAVPARYGVIDTKRGESLSVTYHTQDTLTVRFTCQALPETDLEAAVWMGRHAAILLYSNCEALYGRSWTECQGETIRLTPLPGTCWPDKPISLEMTGCHADMDGECSAAGCPQMRDNEPHATGRHCPLPHWADERD